MNNRWQYLREFESRELVKRYTKEKLGYSINSSKASEITSAFTQGREYFLSSSKADISVRPLLQYYGVVSLSRSLILLLKKQARENNITPSHGLRITNWSDVVKEGKIENIKLRSSKGTFFELLNATRNTSLLRFNSSGIDWKLKMDIPPVDKEYNFKEISFCFPNLHQSLTSWLNIEIPSREIKSIEQKGDKVHIKVQGKYDSLIFDKLFPSNIYDDVEFTDQGDSPLISYTATRYPSLSQKWESTFGLISDIHIVPPFSNGVTINETANIFAVSFVLGTISRYYPTTWNNINKGISNDSMLPFAINLMDFIQDKFPQIIIDFLKSHHDQDLN